MALTFPSVAALFCYLGAALSSERHASLLAIARREPSGPKIARLVPKG